MGNAEEVSRKRSEMGESAIQEVVLFFANFFLPFEETLGRKTPPLGQQLLPAPSARQGFMLLAFSLPLLRANQSKNMPEKQKFKGTHRGMFSGKRY